MDPQRLEMGYLHLHPYQNHESYGRIQHLEE
uniref:Uncharacterized protein n=1 Tax=Arundo donax TaxID=35708 RepID=A0A0A9HEB5_ARUDO